ncbi:ABC transporter ATP-binding protein, partial [Mesorhizobium sp. M2A.F.Ca.ET.042.01.1.1]|uniref:ABC transporter ATP-binding protein n=1 Tax=Mesorhizobium sp. M2A.F.Ca.ET.042.01.1.1 TaxID=2496745 RepID=UPI000FD3CA24
MIGASLTIERLHKQYGNVAALAGLELELQPGEFMTFLGASGSGKTTALNIIAGFSEATTGDVKINGKSILHLPSEQRNIGMVFQSYSLFPHLNVFENIAFPLRLRNVREPELTRRVNAALETVQMGGYSKRLPRELSGGQSQRVAFARAVVFEPPVLLMDEPLSALDLKLREQMQTEIKRYHIQLGCTIIFVTHDQSEALRLSDRIAVMSDGRVQQVGSPGDVYDCPNSKFVAEFIGTTNLFKIGTESAGGGIALPEIGVQLLLPQTGSANYLSVRPEKFRRVVK